MKRRQTVKLFKRGLTLDLNFSLTAVYEEQGSFEGSLWPARAKEKGDGQRYLLVAGAGIGLEVYDRIEMAQGLFRVLWVRAFAKHTEALVEKEVV